MTPDKTSETPVQRVDEARLDEIETRAKAATAGPWKAWPDEIAGGEYGNAPVVGEREPPPYQSHGRVSISEADGAFIAEARTDVPDLCADLRAARLALATATEHARLAEADARAWQARCEANAATVRTLMRAVFHKATDEEVDGVDVRVALTEIGLTQEGFATARKQREELLAAVANIGEPVVPLHAFDDGECIYCKGRWRGERGSQEYIHEDGCAFAGLRAVADRVRREVSNG